MTAELHSRVQHRLLALAEGMPTMEALSPLSRKHLSWFSILFRVGWSNFFLLNYA